MKLAQILSSLALSALIVLSGSSISPSVAAPQSSSLHRADFRIEGASCVACLRRIAQALKTSKGVIKADVSIYRPYWAIVIYDAKQTDFPTVKTAIKGENVKIAELEDKVIAEVPMIVIPKGLGLATGPKVGSAGTTAIPALKQAQ